MYYSLLLQSCNSEFIELYSSYLKSLLSIFFSSTSFECFFFTCRYHKMYEHIFSLVGRYVTGMYVYMPSHPSLHLFLLSSWDILFHIVSNKQIEFHLASEDNANIGAVTRLFYHTIIYRWSFFFLSPRSNYLGSLFLSQSTWFPRLLLIRFFDPSHDAFGTSRYRTYSNLNNYIRVPI